MAATRARIDDLRKSLNQPDKQAQATKQQADDGSWGMGIDPNVWYLRLYYTVEDGLTRDKQPQYPLNLLDRINSPEKLNAQLNSALYDDFTHTGEFKREELDETASAIMRLLDGHERSGYTFDPWLSDAMREYINRWQNPETGCWGQWIVDRYGSVWKMDDTGITFHVISDLHGQVLHLDRIARRLIELEKLDEPDGPRMSGHYENHLNIVSVTADGAYDGMPTYGVVASHGEDIRVLNPPHATAVPSAEAEQNQSQRDQHILTITARGRIGWQKESDYGQRALVETAMGRYKAIVGPCLRDRSFSGQKAEAAVGVAVLNRMLDAGRPDSVRRLNISA